MYQAGIKNITLIENKSVTWNHYDALDAWKISNIEYSGNAIQVLNDQYPKFDVNIRPGNFGKLNYEYSLDFYIYNYITENYDIFEQLKESIYGWLMLVEFYDGTNKFYPSPVYFTQVDFKPHEEMSFPVKLTSKVPTNQRYYEYTPGISTVAVYRADTTLLTADSTYYTADYSL